MAYFVPVVNTVEVNKRLLNLIRALPGEIERSLIAEASRVLAVAKERTPVDTRALQDSGMIIKLEASGSHETKVDIQFGGYEPSSGYALFVHEDLNMNHPNGGQAKFLESAVEDAIPGQLQRIAAGIKLERAMG